MKPFLLACAAGVVLVVAWPHLHQLWTHGIPPDDSAHIAQQIHAATCFSSRYYVQSRLDGSKQRIYVCQTYAGRDECVTEQNGVVSNATAEVRLLFANTLGAQNVPACVANPAG